MSERSHYEPGVPCWVDTLQPDPSAVMRFYEEVFGWEFAGPGPMAGHTDGQYFVARLEGRDVAGLGAQPSPGEMPARWDTYVSVENLERALETVRAAGGEVLAGPLDASPAGRMAVIADPAGAALCLWEAGQRQGAQIVDQDSAWSMSSLVVASPAAVSKFYERLFGWQLEIAKTDRGEFTLWRLPGYVGGTPHQPVPRDVVAVSLPLEAPSLPARWDVGFWIADADKAATTAAALGGRVIAGPFEAAGFRTAVLQDPAGAVFSVSTLLAA